MQATRWLAAGRFYAEAARFKRSEFWSSRAVRARPVERESSERLPLTACVEVEIAPEAHFEAIPTIQSDFIAPAPGIVLPGAGRPIVFLNEMAVAPLVAMIQGPVTVERLLNAWSQHMSRDRAAQALCWLWEAGVLRSCGSPNNLFDDNRRLNRRGHS